MFLLCFVNKEKSRHFRITQFFFGWCRTKCNIFSLDLLKTHNFLTSRQAIFLTVSYLWSRYAILIHWDWQLSRRFYVFDWVTSFLHQDMQVSRRFYDLNKICFLFSRHPMKKMIVAIDVARFPRPETTTTKNALCKFGDSDNTALNRILTLGQFKSWHSGLTSPWSLKWCPASWRTQAPTVRMARFSSLLLHLVWTLCNKGKRKKKAFELKSPPFLFDLLSASWPLSSLCQLAMQASHP